MPVEGWQQEYGELLDGIAAVLPPGTDLTVECITHRFTPGSKATLLDWYPRTRLEMDEEQRTTKRGRDRKSTRLNSSHANISYAVFCLNKNNTHISYCVFTFTTK